MTMSLTELFIKQYQLCGLTDKETVGVIYELGKKTEYVEAAVAAARSLGAGALVLGASSLSNPTLPPYTSDGREVPALLAGAGNCDLVIDVTVGGLIHSSVRVGVFSDGLCSVVRTRYFLGRHLCGNARLIGFDRDIHSNTPKAGDNSIAIPGQRA